MAGSAEYRQRVRYALAQLTAANGQFIFEELCFALARVTVTSNIQRATGPVGAGGDQGRDFETFQSRLGHVGSVGAAAGVEPDDRISFVCTLQRSGVEQKILSDVERCLEGAAPPTRVYAYCEQDVPIGRRHRLLDQVASDFGISLEVLDGNAIADLLAAEVTVLGPTVARLLNVSPSSPSTIVPRDLPRPPLRFVNRERELAHLDQLAADVAATDGTMVAVLTGMHGVGKSSMATLWANRNRRSFEGGDLYGDFSQRRRGNVVDVSEVLADFLRQLGTPDERVPTDFGDRQRMFQRLTTTRSMLVLLDDVDQPAQVLAALPAGARSMVVVTTNYMLEELFAEGAEYVAIDPLDSAASRDLLASLAGAGRIEVEVDATARLIEVCDGLPVALCVCGARLGPYPERTVHDLVSQIGEAGSRIAALSSTGAFALQAVFDSAYEDLAADTRRVYRRLGLHPAKELTTAVASALAGAELRGALVHLDTLVSVHLVERLDHERLRLHGIVHDHALLRSTSDDTPGEVDSARRRMVEWYYRAVQAADWAIVADRLRLTDRPASQGATVPSFGEARAAFDWFAMERTNVIAAVRIAFEREWDEMVWRFAEALWPLCASHKLFAEWVESHQLAAEASVRIGNRAAEARIRSQLARAHAERGNRTEAIREMDAASTAARECGLPLLEASVIEFAGVCHLTLGDPASALSELTEARRRFAGAGRVRSVALQDLYAGSALIELGRADEALDRLDDAERGLTESCDDISVGRVLLSRGEALSRLGRNEEAASALEDAIAIMVGLGIMFEQADAYERLAAIAFMNDENAGRGYLQRAYRIYEEIGDARADAVLARLAPSG